MGSLVLEMKRQTSFFFKDKIKKARLVLTDVTPIELLTEETTNGDLSAPDVAAMRLISRAAFEVDDYERIVHVLHERLSKFDKSNWRASYKALVLLEHLLTHGPRRTVEEFQSDEEYIKQMASFNFVDEKGFNWGLSVRKKCERILKLIEDDSYLQEEKAKARKLTVGIKGFGSFIKHEEIRQQDKSYTNSDKYFRSNSLFSDLYHREDREISKFDENMELLVNENPTKTSRCATGDEDHPFCDNKENWAKTSLLSST